MRTDTRHTHTQRNHTLKYTHKCNDTHSQHKYTQTLSLTQHTTHNIPHTPYHSHTTQARKREREEEARRDEERRKAREAERQRIYEEEKKRREADRLKLQEELRKRDEEMKQVRYTRCHTHRHTDIDRNTHRHSHTHTHIYTDTHTTRTRTYTRTRLDISQYAHITRHIITHTTHDTLIARPSVTRPHLRSASSTAVRGRSSCAKTARRAAPKKRRNGNFAASARRRSPHRGAASAVRVVFVCVVCGQCRVLCVIIACGVTCLCVCVVSRMCLCVLCF